MQLVGYSIWQRANLHRAKSAIVSERDVTEGIALAEARFHDVVHEPGPTRVPGAVLLPAVRPAALPHVDLAHVGPDRVVHDPVHDRDGWTPPRSSLS